MMESCNLDGARRKFVLQYGEQLFPIDRFLCTDFDLPMKEKSAFLGDSPSAQEWRGVFAGGAVDRRPAMEH